MFGIVAVVAHRTSALGRWSEIGAIVGGAIASAAFIGGVARWLWARWNRPKLVIECGNGEYEFERRLGATPFIHMVVEGGEVGSAYAKFLRVRETRGRSAARDVVARLTKIEPPPPTLKVVELRWTDESDTTSIQPHGHKYLMAQMVVLFVDTDGDDRCRVTPTVLEHSSPVDFTVELLVEGKRNISNRFRMEFPWPILLLSYAGEGWPDPIPFPKITRVER